MMASWPRNALDRMVAPEMLLDGMVEKPAALRAPHTNT